MSSAMAIIVQILDWQRLIFYDKEIQTGQYPMLADCPYVIVPLFKCVKLNTEWVSKLNPLTTSWCVAKNKEHNIDLEKLGVPNG